MVVEKTLESPLDCKEIQPVHPKGDQSWVFIGRTDAEAETPVLWPPDAKSWLIGKDPDTGREWGQEEKGTTEDDMVGWHHRLDGHMFGWTPGVGDGQGGLACCDSWGRKESDMTERLNWTEPGWNHHSPSPSPLQPSNVSILSLSSYHEMTISKAQLYIWSHIFSREEWYFHTILSINDPSSCSSHGNVTGSALGPSPITRPLEQAASLVPSET